MRTMIKRQTGVIAVAALCLAGAGLLGVPGVEAETGASTISGAMFDDADRDGVRDTGEAPFPDRMVELYSDERGWVTSAFTDADGGYLFEGLADGPYTLYVRTSDWLTLRDDWVPTFNDSLRYTRAVAVAGNTAANLGLRRIVRSTTVGAPISSATAANGTRFESYNDVVDAAELLAAWEAGTLRGAQPSEVVVRFDVNTGNSCVTSYAGGPGTFSAFSASVWLSYASWLDTGDRGLFHEYGHAWTLYHALIVQQDDTLAAYLDARGLAGDSRLDSDKNWSPREMIAEDYRRLFGSPSARSYALANTQIPPAEEVPGLAEWMRDTFTQAPAAPAGTPSDPAPSPTAEPLAVDDVAVNPTPVLSQGTIGFSLNKAATVTVRIVDEAGRTVRTLVSATAASTGAHESVWDRKNDAGRKVKAGTYTVVVDAVDDGGAAVTSGVPFQVVDGGNGGGGGKRK